MEEIPKIGIGTWRLKGDECESIVKMALDVGYRHIDTAFNYENQESVGKALRGFDREQLFITSKVMLNQGGVEEICDQSLKELGIDFLDLYVIHWPDRSYPIENVLESLERLKKQGKIRKFGVSNFTVFHLQDWIRLGADIYCNQVEFHPCLYQKELWQFCKEHHIEIVAYRPLGKGALLKEPLICQMAHVYSKTAAQILLRWLFQKNISWIAKASSRERLQENFAIIDFNLKESDMQAIDALNRGQRFCQQSWSDFDYKGF